MQILLNSGNRVGISEALEAHVRANLESELERFGDRLTRIEVHLNDENSGKSGPRDKRCQMEARIKTHDPVSVTHMADSFQLASDGAASKLGHALEHVLGKLDRI